VIGLLQRVRHASVEVEHKEIAQINQGLLVFIGIEQGDGESQADRLLTRLLGYRIFSDADDKMNLSVRDITGGVLLVPKFTLAANTNKGLRPSFSSAAPPEQSEVLFDYFCTQAKQAYTHIETGQFGADMQVSLTNDGPVTFNLHIPPTV